ncbi:MAG: tetratricopeptide repeat protein [Cytophagales bacterium]|nr:tetratricopeptide repeat protein [Bernardetiaceae bacterium]MDW8206075.1 tetratricopeptide repeat protein [Cytophagales bacterium]
MKKLLLAVSVAAISYCGYAQKEDKEVTARAKEAYKAAESAFKKKDFATAATEVDKSFESEKYKNDPKAWMFRGDIYAELAVADSANTDNNVVNKRVAIISESYAKAVELNKNYDLLYIQPKLQNIYAKYFNWGVAAYQNDNDFEKAAADFERANMLKPTDTLSAFFALVAASQNTKKDYNKIEELAQKCIKLGVKDVSVYYALLDKYISIDQNYDKALAVLKEAREKNPTDKNLMFQQIQVYIKTGKEKEAIADLEKALETTTDPKERFPVALNLGILQENAKNLDAAEKAYKEAYALQPDNDDAIYSLGAFYYNKGAAIKKEADNMDMETFKKEGKAVIDRAKVYFEMALPFFQKTIVNNPDDMQRLGALNSIYNILEKPAEMLPYYKAAVEKNPDDATLMLSYIQAADKAGKIQEVVPLVEAAVKKRPTDVETLQNLLYVYEKTKRIKDAEPWFKQAVSIYPDNIELLEGYSRILYTIGKKKEADAIEVKIEQLQKAKN